MIFPWRRGFQNENKKLVFLKHDLQCTRRVFNDSLFIWRRVFFFSWRGFQIEIKNLFSWSVTETVCFQWFFIHLAKCEFFFRWRGFNNSFGEVWFFYAERFSNWKKKLFSWSVTETVCFQWFYIHLAKCDFF